MRFRANIENANTFRDLVSVVKELQKVFTIKFTETDMHIVCDHELNEGGLQVWSSIKVDSIFSDYRVQSNANNEIIVELASEALFSALKSASPSGKDSTSSFASGAEVVMKLAKKNDQAVLSFEMTGVTRMNRRLKVTHDVRIEVKRPQDFSLREPACPDPDMHILLPPLDKLRTVVERMRPVAGGIMAIKANGSGCLQLCSCTDDVRIDVTWTGLTNPAMNSSNSQNQSVDDSDPSHMYGVVVNLKGFHRFLSSHVVCSTTIACICQNHAIILYVYIGDVADTGGVLTFYLPARHEGTI